MVTQEKGFEVSQGLDSGEKKTFLVGGLLNHRQNYEKVG
jgi:hypothetical protein